MINMINKIIKIQLVTDFDVYMAVIGSWPYSYGVCMCVHMCVTFWDIMNNNNHFPSFIF